MKIPIYIVLNLALVWFGGAGLAFATCPGTNTLPACPCNHGHGESCCCCESKTPAKSNPTCSFNPKAVPLCSCNYTRDDSSATTAAVYRAADPAIVLDSKLETSNPAYSFVNQTFQALPSSNKPFTPLRI